MSFADPRAEEEDSMADRRHDSTDLFVEPDQKLEQDEQQQGCATTAARHEHVTNSSPWAIGMSHYDQRDLYTTNASTDDDGYGCGPSYHPEEGSYAYHREFHPGTIMLRLSNANLYEREAWPWLNYSATDPYFVHIYARHDDHAPRSQDRNRESPARRGLRAIKARASSLASRIVRIFRTRPQQQKPSEPLPPPRTDAQLRYDVERALLRRVDLDDHDIAVDVIRAEVTLEGTVPDRRSKRAAGKTTAQVPGIRTVRNHLEIRHDDTSDADLALASPYAFGA
jgi:hypothetical protein